MTVQKYNNAFIVAEGFIVFVVIKLLMIVLATVLVGMLSNANKTTIYVLTSGIFSTLLAILYLWIRTKYMPKIKIHYDSIMYSIAGVIFMWFFLYIGLLFFGFNDVYIKKLIGVSGVYKYINVFWFAIWSPVTEELIFRGYFLEMLSHKKPVIALLITSLLFVTLHIIFSLNPYNYLMIISCASFFIFSMIVGFVYLHAGLMPAIIVHMFSNIYFLIVTV